MKQITLILASILISASAAAAPDSPLKIAMQKIGNQFHTIAQQINDPTMNASTLTAVKEVNVAAKEAFDLSPAIIATQPADVLAKSQVNYQRFLAQLMVDDLDLQEALLNNDNTTAVAVLRKMADLRNQAHAIFNPQPPHP